MNPEERIIEHAEKLGALEANYGSIKESLYKLESSIEKISISNIDTLVSLKEEIKDVRHDLANEKLNKEFKKAIVDDYSKLSETVGSIDAALKAANWFAKNWRLVSVLGGLLIIGLTTTTIDFGDKLYKANPPKIHKNP